METSKKILPKPVIQRLPKYLTHVHELVRQKVTWVSSIELAKSLGFTSSTVRQDLSHLALRGISKRGYNTTQLSSVIRSELGADTKHRILIVGAGYLGCALALHGDLISHGFEVCGIFDSNEEIIGSRVGELSILSMDSLGPFVSDKNVEMGLIAVPPAAAQIVADQLVEAGIKGILNLAYTHISVPPSTVVIDARFLASLQELAHAVRGSNHSAKATSDQIKTDTQKVM